MNNRRSFFYKLSVGGIAGIVASGSAPVYAQGVRLKKRGVSMDEAREVHDTCLIIDGHNDRPVETVARGERKLDWHSIDTAYNLDIPRMKEGGFDAGSFIVGNGKVADIWVTSEIVLEEIEAHPDIFIHVRSANDILQAREQHKIGIIMGVESIGHWAEERIDIVRMLYRIGVRLMGIIYMQGTKSSMAACTPKEREEYRRTAVGLVPFGFEVLKEVNELGIVPDVSHINDTAFFEVMEHSTKPPLVSHTAVFTLCNNYRCLTDDQIKALAEAGGAMGITFVPRYIDADPEKATIDSVAQHVCYVADLVGIDYVGIGSDFDGIGQTVPVVPDPAQFVHLTRSMLAYGLTAEEIRKVWGGNFLRVIQASIG